MLIIPAIDLKDGKVVRLRQGRYDQKKIYSSDPVKTAKHWKRQGAKLIHIVDLDGASSGKTKNLDSVKKIAEQIDVPLEFGGGVRTKETIKKLLNLGISRVILGTKATDPRFLTEVFKKFKDKVIVSIDSRSEIVFTHGWGKSGRKINQFDLAAKLKKIGFKEVIYTDITRDGMLKGPNIPGIKKMLKTGLKVVGSGGVSSIVDLLKMKALEKQGLTSVIVGKALYEAKFTLKEAIKAAEGR